MKKFFIVLLKYVKPLEDIDIHRPSHLDFLEHYYKEEVLLISGPQVPRNGGVLLAQCKNKENLMVILQNDPFMVNKLATYEVIEFAPTKYNDIFNQIMSH